MDQVASRAEDSGLTLTSDKLRNAADIRPTVEFGIHGLSSSVPLTEPSSFLSCRTPVEALSALLVYYLEGG